MITTTLQKRQKRITLRDVIAHIHVMKGSLMGEIEGLRGKKGAKHSLSSLSSDMEKMETWLTKKIDANTEGLKEVTERLGKVEAAVIALDEDRTATMDDTVKIRRHVGMAVSQEL